MDTDALKMTFQPHRQETGKQDQKTTCSLEDSLNTLWERSCASLGQGHCLVMESGLRRSTGGDLR